MSIVFAVGVGVNGVPTRDAGSWGSSTAKPRRVQFRATVPQEQPAGRGPFAGGEIEIREENVILAERRTRQNEAIRVAHERFSGEVEAVFLADAIAKRDVIPVVQRG